MYPVQPFDFPNGAIPSKLTGVLSQQTRKEAISLYIHLANNCFRMLRINLPSVADGYSISGVYRISFDDGSFYIGSSVHLHNRAGEWHRYFENPAKKSNTSPSIRMLNKIKEANSAVFDILKLCLKSDVRDLESFYLDKHKDDPNMISNELVGAWVAVLQYNRKGNFIKKHYSISAAAKAISTTIFGIQRVLSGERKYCKDFSFIYEHEYHKKRKKAETDRRNKNRRPTEKKSGRKILMMDSKGVVVASFKTIKKAAEAVTTSATTVIRVLNKRQRTAGGFIFNYGPPKLDPQQYIN